MKITKKILTLFWDDGYVEQRNAEGLNGIQIDRTTIWRNYNIENIKKSSKTNSKEMNER